jgi:hypothetical protein
LRLAVVSVQGSGLPMSMPQGTYRYPNMDRVLFGRDFAEGLAEERARLGAGRLSLLAIRSR